MRYFFLAALTAVSIWACTPVEEVSTDTTQEDTTTQGGISPDPSDDAHKEATEDSLIALGASAPDKVGNVLFYSLQANNFDQMKSLIPDSSLVLQHYIDRKRDTSTYAKTVYRDQAIAILNTVEAQWKEARKAAADAGFDWQNAMIVTTEQTALPEGGIQYTSVDMGLQSGSGRYTLSITSMPIGGKWYAGEKIKFRKTQ
ncbi:MAG: hypothetical protein M3Q97_00915 [Bacteroidota bacterium]|nr:hypothetical protein [Bacteroidota bacterium]